MITIQGKDDISLLINMLNYLSAQVEKKNKDLQVCNKQISIQENMVNSVKEGLERKVYDLFTLFDIGKEFDSTLFSQKILQMILFSCMGQIGISNMAILLINDESPDKLTIQMSKGITKEVEKEIAFSLKGKLGQFFFNKPMIILKESFEEVCSEDEAVRLEKLKASLLVPLSVKKKLKGLLSLGSKLSGEEFSDEDKQFLFTLSNMASLALENAHLYLLSITDGLTKVYTRGYFQLRLEEEFKRSRRYRHPLSFVMIDIDDFKKVNEIYGYSQGDLILARVANIIKNNLREVDIISRYSGEKFIVFMPEASKNQALEAAKRLRLIIKEESFLPEEKGLHITASMGIAGYPLDTEDINSLFECAKESLYKAKAKGKNTIYLFYEK